MGQGLLKEISLAQQIGNADVIVEGRVTNKKAYWDINQSKIYTVNTIEVYKVFKGMPVDRLKMITPGGTLDLNAEIVQPSLSLSKNDVGIFMLSSSNIKLKNSSSENFFIPYSSLQGFHKYNEAENVAKNPFSTRYGISNNFYKEITDITRNRFVEVAKYHANIGSFSPNRNQETGEISSISPSTSTAGTNSVLNIFGTGFGSNQGVVSFPDADDGGDTYIDAFDLQILSWADTEIEVIIPSFAGSGPVRVITESGSQFISDELNIQYAHISLVPDSEDPPMEYPVQLYNDDGQGGYNWFFNNDFNNNVAATEAFTRAFDQWVCKTGVNWRIEGESSIDVTDRDATNIIRFDNGSELPDGIVGRTTSYYNGCSSVNGINWFVIELDIVFDDATNWNFSLNPPVGSSVDFETVAVHELGHGLQLGHVILPNAIMHFEVSPRTANRDLVQSDIDGAKAIVERSVNTSVCSQTSMVVFDCNGPQPPPLGNSILIFPNPTNGRLYLRRSVASPLQKIELYDLRGRLILTTNLDPSLNEHVLELGFLSPGIYSLKIEMQDQTINKNIVIK